MSPPSAQEMPSQEMRPSPRLSRTDLCFILAACLAVLAYLYGLGDVGIPANGDENVYIHIARTTAQSGHWLPLSGDIPQVRNTKPPMLFWQAMASTGLGSWWSLWWIRLPSVLYTLGTASLLVLLIRHLTGQWGRGALAACLYLAFYSTYRYGRPLLTDAPETFWLCLPAMAVLASRGEILSSRIGFPLLSGAALGIACLYKSFALLVPFCLLLVLWHWVCHGRDLRHWLRVALPGITITAVVGLGIFLLWPLLDPDPQAIWQDFVVKENAGKFDSRSGPLAYLAAFLWGGGSIWKLLGALLANAGLLAPLLVVQFIDAWRNRRSLSREEKLLWAWLLAFFIAFALPSQRSGRYLLPAMPAVAALATLTWARLPRAGVVITAGLATLVAAVLIAFSALVVQQAHDLSLPLVYWGLLGGIFIAGLASLIRPTLAATSAPVLVLGLLWAMGLQLTAYAAPPGPFTPEIRAFMADKTVFVPCDFLASEEAHRFMLPGADVRSYADWDNLTPEQLAGRYRFFAAYVALGEEARCPGCRVLGERYVVRGRRTANSLGHSPSASVLREFFSREVLFESTRAPAQIPSPAEACAR